MSDSFGINLKSQSTAEWANHCIENFDSFILDHAACERKASATGISLVVRYPDRSEIIMPLIKFSQEELVHFAEVMKLVKARKLQSPPDEKDLYMNKILGLIRKGRDEEFLDRLLCVGIVEARGCERFRIIGETIEDKPLKDFYIKLAKAEERHHELFVKLALKYFSSEVVEERLDELLTVEASIIKSLPIRAAVH